MRWFKSISLLSCILTLCLACARNDEDQATADRVPANTIPTSEQDSPSQQHSYRLIRTQEGTVARNSGGPKYPGQLRLEQNLTIGRDEGPEEYLLFLPTIIAVDGAGNIYVFDRKRMGIMVYDFAGRFRRQLGREGEGPGELVSLSSYHVYEDGTVDVIGFGGRWQRWATNGRLLFDRRARNIMASLSIERRTTKDGIISYAFKDPWYGVVTADTSTGWWIISQNDSFASNQVVAKFPRGNPTKVSGYFEGDHMGMISPYSQELIVAQSPTGGYAISNGDSATFTIYSETFSKQLDVVWDYALQPLTESEVLTAYRVAGFFDGPLQDKMLRFVKNLKWPDTKPVITRIIISLDGRYWVETWGEDPWAAHKRYSQSDYFRYWVFSTDGVFEYDIT